jgi:hypothetical protein
MSIIVVVLLWIMSGWLTEGYHLAGLKDTVGTAKIISAVLGVVFIAALGSAIGASVLIHLLGWWIGVPVAAAAVWLVVVRPRTGLAYLFYEHLRLGQVSENVAEPVTA